jgi:hypothetical protein
MLSALSRYVPAIPPPPPLLLARGDTFFIRRVDLAPGEAIEPQVRLALEGMAPFPPEQLYFGHLTAGDNSAALVFASFRRRFTAEETEDWDRAAFVAPEFAPLLAARPGPGGGSEDGAVVHIGETRITALAWRRGLELPVAVLSRTRDPATEHAVIEELWERSGLPSGAGLRRLEGTLGFGSSLDGSLTATLGDETLGPWPQEWSRSGDVRDQDFLADRRRAEVRDQWLWRGLLGAVAILVLAATLQIGAAVLGALTRHREARIERQAPTVRQTETAQALANRIAELSEKRLMPFEMMAIINPSRPESVIFQRAVTRGLLRLEVEAQAQNAEDVGRYANALRSQPGVAAAAARDIRAREGVTSFILDVEFKPEALRNGGAL